MNSNDWTRSETISAPDEITIKWKTDDGDEREQVLISTTKSTSETQYQTIAYTDATGNIKQDDVAIRKEDIKYATKASVNQDYISMRLKYDLGLPSGGDQERSVTTYEHGTSVDGPVVLKETTEVYISYLAFMGQLQGIEYAWTEVNVNTGESTAVYYSPVESEVLSHRTIIEHKSIRTDDGRDMTITKTSRWTAVGMTSEGKTSFAKWMKVLKGIGWTVSRIDSAVDEWTPLKFEGTEVQTSIGRPSPAIKPSDADLLGDQVVNGTTPTESSTPTEKYGNDLGWTKYVPPGIDPATLAGDSNNDGVPDWAPYVPDDWTDYNVDSNNDGIPDWADYVPPDENWEDYVADPQDWENTAIDSNSDGVPDWADNTPIGYEEFDTSASDYAATSSTSSNEHSITGRVIFDGQNYQDSNPTYVATYDMPYAPDDTFIFVKNVRKLVEGGAVVAAHLFGKTESALDIGHAYGFNIVSGFNEIPTLDMAPVYIRLGGLEVALLTDSLSYAWGPEGMVVSSDLMLMGVTGYYGSTPPNTSWIRLPVAPINIGTAGSPTIENSPGKANSIAIPGGFDIRNPAPTLSLLPSNDTDVFAEWRSDAVVVPPTFELLTAALATAPVVGWTEYSYSLSVTVDEVVITSQAFIDDGQPSIVNSTAAPLLGAGQVTPTTIATAAGWTLAFNDTDDEGNITATGFGFNFTFNSTAYTSCYVNSNSYITFGASVEEYQNLGAGVPSEPKLHIGSGDWSYQRVYTKAGAGVFRIRWEGNSAYDAVAGSSNRFLEVAFIAPLDDGSQLIEVRSGNINGSTSGPFMLATSSTALATGTFAANQSWVFEGNADGTTWTVSSGKHVTGTAS